MTSFPEEDHDLFTRGILRGLVCLVSVMKLQKDMVQRVWMILVLVFRTCHLRVTLTLMDQWLALQARHGRPCMFLMSMHSMVIWTEHGTPWIHRQ